MSVSMQVPEVGESIKEVQISQWLKEEGDWVEQDEDLVEVDSEKASLAIPAPTAGRLVKIIKHDGDTVAVGDVIAEIDDTAESQQSSESEQAAESEPAAKDDARQPADSEPHEHQESAVKPPPRATDHGQTAPAQSAAAQSSAAEGAANRRRPPRPEHKDPPQDQRPAAPPQPTAQPAAKRPLAAQLPATEHSADREEEVVPMSMIRRHIAARLVEAQQNSALLTTFNEIDLSAVIELRSLLQAAFQQQYGVKLGFMSFFVKATIEALKRYPEVNAEVRDQSVVFHNYYDIGIAIGGGKGLVVPVLRDADQMSFAEVESAIDDFGKRAQDNKLTPDELTGGTFTISNGGIYGSLLSTPIVNPPQSGVLGMHAIQDRPVARESQVVIRPMMYVALTYDHRIVDGREAIGCLRHIKDLIEQPSRILLEV